MRFEHASCIMSFIREVLCFVRCQFKVKLLIDIDVHVPIIAELILSQGGSFVKVGLSIDDPNYPCSQGIKRLEVSEQYCLY